MPRSDSDNFADLDEVEYRDYKRELLKKSRADGSVNAPQASSVFFCALLFVAAAFIVLYHYGVVTAAPLTR